MSPERAGWIAFVGFLAASPAYVLCRSTHFCMGGHLPDHGAAGHSHAVALGYLFDAIWVVAFGLAVVLAFLSGLTFRYAFVFALGVGFLFIADPSGIVLWPAHVVLSVFAIACLKGWID